MRNLDGKDEPFWIDIIIKMLNSKNFGKVTYCRASGNSIGNQNKELFCFIACKYE